MKKRWHVFKVMKHMPPCCETEGGTLIRISCHSDVGLYINNEWTIIGRKPGDNLRFRCEHGGSSEMVLDDVRHFEHRPYGGELDKAISEMGIASPEDISNVRYV